MKKIITHSLTLSVLLIIASSLCHGQANTSLSNLVAPTAINQDLSPNKNNKLNLGNSSKSWKKLFIADGLYKDTTRIFSADSTNIAAGYHALTINTGKFNTAIGAEALRSNSTGILNTANGASALLYNTSGSGNTATGTDAMYSNTTGNFNTATGYFALALNKTGMYNVANGDYALYSNTTGYSNVAIGTKTLYKNQTGSHLIAIGDSALLNSVIASNDIALGDQTLPNNTTGSDNIAFGYKALYDNTTGGANIAIGSLSNTNNTTGNYNISIGSSSLLENSTGKGNTVVGYVSSEGLGTGSNNCAIGVSTDFTGSAISNSVAIGASAKVDASNKVRIGNTSVTSIGGQVGWTTFSDARYKKNIKENVPGLDFINALRPVTFSVDINGLNNYFEKGSHTDSLKNNAVKKSDDLLKDSYDKASKIVHTGFIAQEVEAVANKLNYDFSGIDKPGDKNKLYGLRYDEFVVPLVKAVQELSNENSALKNENEKQQKINADLQKQIDDLKNLMTHSSQTSAISNQQKVFLSQTARLEQNQPNPTAQSTKIKYFIPEQISTAIIRITNSNGQEIKSINLSQKNNGQITLQTNDLASGTYFYSLSIDGKTVDTKKMVIIH